MIVGSLTLVQVAHALDVKCPKGSAQKKRPDSVWCEDSSQPGVKEGPFVSLYEQGTKHLEGHFEKDLPVGKWAEWSRTSKPVSERSFESGAEAEMNSLWDRDRRLSPHHLLSDDLPSLQMSPAVEEISAAIQKNPGMAYSDLIEFANAAIRKRGLYFAFDVSRHPALKHVKGLNILEDPYFYRKNRWVWETFPWGDKFFAFRHFLDFPCALAYVVLPVTQFSKSEIEFIHNGAKMRVPFESWLGVEWVTVHDSAKRKLIFKKIPIPATRYQQRKNEILSVSPDGKSIFYRVPLKMSAFADWWRDALSINVAKEGTPYLSLEISEHGFGFSDDINQLAPRAQKWQENFEYFENNHFFVEWDYNVCS